MTHGAVDPLFRQLAGLKSEAPDPTHRASVRARCHAALARQRRKPKAGAESAESPVTRPRRFEVALAAALAVVYLAAVVSDALTMYGTR